MTRLRGEPIDLVFAGPIGVHIPQSISGLSNVAFLGPVSHEQATVLYRNSDILLLPTLSDGSGLVQLQALANGLPVIASKNCAKVSRPPNQLVSLTRGYPGCHSRGP